MTPQDFTRIVRRKVLSRKNYNKIFCIGYNKTGTTTLELVLKLYGFNLPNQQDQEARLTERCLATDYTELESFVRGYDAFQDLPFAQGQTYVAADALFPNSRFILSVRDPDDWFRSLTSFHKKMFGLDDPSAMTEQDVLEKLTYLYEGYSHVLKTRHLTTFSSGEAVVDWSKLYDKDYYVELYEARNRQIRTYFASAPEKLLVIDVTQERTTEKICRFLNIPEKFVIDMPQANKT